MNFARLAEAAGLQEEEFLELAQDFVEIGILDLVTLRAGIEEGDATRVFESAHSIKGAAVNFGFEEIFRVAKELEAKARRGVLEGSREAAQLLGDKFAEIMEALLVKAASSHNIVE